MRRLLLPLLPLTLLTALAACGSEDSDDARDGGSDGPTSSGLASVDFSRDLGCGHGFSVTDESETTLLSVHVGSDTESGLERTTTLPDPAWTAEVLVGTHLAANWCSDVIDQPEADVDETWTVVEGTLTFADQVPTIDGSENEQPVQAELTGVVVENADGERVELGDFSLTNSSWGFFAG